MILVINVFIQKLFLILQKPMETAEIIPTTELHKHELALHPSDIVRDNRKLS